MDSEDDLDGTLQSFMFGNIDESGRLEDDIFDEESKQHLSCLSNFGLGSLVKELVDSEEADDSANDNEFNEKSENAVDYSDIIETVADAEETPLPESNGDVTVVVSEGESVPKAEANPPEQGSDQPEDRLLEESKEQPAGSDGVEGSSKAVLKLNTPLASLLPPELADCDVRQWFPDFHPDKVLRFSRIFRPPYEPNNWKLKKKRKPFGPLSESAESKPLVTADKTAKPLLPTTSTSIRETNIRQSNDTSSVNVVDNEVLDVLKVEDADTVIEEEEEDEVENYGSLKLIMGRSPRPDELMADDEDLMMRPTAVTLDSGNDSGSNTGLRSEVAEWRYGPAKLWYDMFDVPESGDGFDYGFQLKGDGEEEDDDQPQNLAPLPNVKFSRDAFLMVNLIHWEDDVIFDSSAEKVKDKVDKLLAQKMPYCGWIPSMTYRTYEQFVKHHNPALHGILQEARFFGPGPFVPSKLANFKPMGQTDDSSKKSRPGFYSIFPVENEDLLYSKWEDDVIWDAKKMDKIPCPPVLTFDPNDDSLILEIPEDNIPPVAEPLEQDTKKEKEVKKSKAVLEKAGILKEEEKEQEKEMPIQNKEPFNLSNDESYNPKLSSDQTLGRNLGVAIVQHSTPAVELRSPYFLTHLTVVKLRCFHHPPLKRYQHGPMAPGAGPHPVLPLLKQIKRKEHQREQERMATGGGEMFFMRTSEDLTGRDGDIIFAEFSEQYPPLMNQVGMATKIKNYYKRKPGKDSDPPSFKFGDMAYAHTSRFLGSLSPGQCLQAFENNMYRAPVYEHRIPDTDILIIRNRTHFYAREVQVIFVIGQQCPLIEVPGPNSKRSNNFIRDFLQVFIYRLFWKSKDTPKRIKMDEIRKAFPTHSENTIRKRLKLCADFKRTGADSNWWVLSSSFRLPTEEEMREMVTPEQCCAYYSMLAAEQRLKDAGYGEKSLFAQDEDNDEETQSKMEDEVKTAPWNTTRAFIAAMKGRCLLDLNGVADPTGCGEGFSYVNVPNKPQQMKDDVATNTPVKKTVTGTDADLRRLPLNEAKQLLRKFGVPESEIKKLSRWEVIDAVRRYSTQQSKACQEGLGGDVISKFARGNRFSVAEHRERYKEECQRIFDLQNRILGSDEVLSTDEDSGSEISDFEEMGKNLETMLCDKKTSSQIRQLREEAGRKELNKMLRENFGKDRADKKEETSSAEAEKGVRILRITRTFLKDDGGEFTRTEIVRNPQVIDRYIKIRETQNPEIIKQYATNDQQKEEMKKEKRRLQEQLRRMKRQQQIKAGIGMPPPKKRKKELNPVNLLKLQRIKCRACGQTGHMKTNRDCPMFNKIKPSGLVGKVAMSEEQEELLERSNLVDKDLIISEGTKIKVSRHLVEHTEQVKRKSLVLKLPKIVSESKKKRRVGKDVQCDYLKKSNKLANRRRADPVVTLSSIFENILKEMKDLPNVKLFHIPVNAKHVPDYYTIIKKPMDLQTIQNNIRSRKYLSRVAFIVDVSLVVKNSETYNGPKSALTAAAQKMLDFCLQRLTEKEEKIMSLEKAINPMLDVDLVSFGYILSGIVEDHMKTIEGSIPFHHPVNKKQCKDYYDLIEQPMDLSTLYKNAKENRYHSQEQFLKHVQLIVSNCEKYNGPASSLTRTAHRLMDVCKQAMKEQEETLHQLEENIRAVQEAAMEGMETDSIVTATSVTGGDAESVKERTRNADNSSTFGVLSQDQFEADDMERMSHDEEDAGQISQFEEFVDVEGAEDDDKNANESFDNPSAFVEDSLERDLRMTPERSDGDAGDDEEDFERQSLKLSSSGSDSEEGQSFRADAINAEMCEYAESNAMYRFDENAQDFNYDEMYMADVQDDGNSFDPQAFFSELVQQERDEFNQDAVTTENDGTNNAQADVNNDLEVSESDESNEGLVPVEDESDQDFNMGDYLNMD